MSFTLVRIKEVGDYEIHKRVGRRDPGTPMYAIMKGGYHLADQKNLRRAVDYCLDACEFDRMLGGAGTAAPNALRVGHD